MTTMTASWPAVGIGNSVRKDQGIPNHRFSSLTLKPQQPQAILLMAESAGFWSTTNIPSSSSSSSSSIQKKAPWAHENNEEEHVTSKKLDHWLRDSIGEIVKNIDEAPFLVHMFSHLDTRPPKLEREAATPEIWSRVTRRWEQGSPMPDGVVLVQEIINNDDSDDDDHRHRTWGLLVQGRGGIDCPAACYILRTCWVGFCTHFCLVRTKCLGESIDKQLRRAWLQQQQQHSG